LRIHGSVQKMGTDILVAIWGGDRPHIGAVGMATPRPSLRDPKQWSATSSNFTFVGHKEDSMVKMISEKLASQLRTNVVVTAGIHWDKIRSEDIDAIEKLSQKLSDLILTKIRSATKGRPAGSQPIHK
jgi:hypothetical protein